MITTVIAQSYREQGLCVLPAIVAHKRPAIGSWKPYQATLPTRSEIDAWFATPHDGCCFICGAVSGNLEIIDFDGKGALYPAWRDVVVREAAGLLDRLVIERTPSGGLHVAYRCAEPVSGNLKLAQSQEVLSSADPVQRFDKTVSPRRAADGRWMVTTTLIETRGEGGLCLCAPSKGYKLVQGDFTHLPVLTSEERDILLRAAWALTEVCPEPVSPPASLGQSLRPGDAFNEQADVAELLRRHGWTLLRDGENQHWSRPGKGTSTSATLRQGVFYVFSSNAAPFEPHSAYRPFAVYTLLEHQGDYRAAAMTLRDLGFGSPATTNDVDLAGLLPSSKDPLPFDLQTFADTPPRDIRWLWPGVIPRGMVSLIGGKQGLGKSFLICDLAARISAGQPLPDGTTHPPGQVLLLAREDDASCVLLPRLRAAKADLTRVFWSVFGNAETRMAIDLATHAQFLIQAVSKHVLDLVVVDTFAAFAPTGSDANAAQDVRILLDALTRVARDSGAAVVVIAHLRKSGQADGDPMDAIAGSAQMTAGVRVAAILEKGDGDGERRLRVVKSNLGPVDQSGWSWRFEWPDPFAEGASDTPRIVWSPTDDHSDLHSVKSIHSDDARVAIREVLGKGSRSLAATLDLVCAKMRTTHAKIRKADAELIIEQMIDEGALATWTGSRGAKLIGHPGSEDEAPEIKAVRLAQADPTMSVQDLRTRAGCRKDTACEALRRARATLSPPLS